MNMARRAANKLQTLKHLILNPKLSSRTIFTTSPLNHSSPSSADAVHYLGNRCCRYDDTRTPWNWGIRIVPEDRAYVVERFGRYVKTLTPGIHWLVPMVDKIAFVVSLKEEAILIQDQKLSTGDYICISIDSMLYVKVVDPMLASYEVRNPMYAVISIARSTLWRELCKMTLDKTFEERITLSARILMAINEAAQRWGLRCLGYEIRNISPPPGIRDALEMQSEAECNKRAQIAQILESEGSQTDLLDS